MKKESLALLVTIPFLTVLTFYSTALAQNTSLKGINCKLEPIERTSQFQKPVKPVNGKDWQVTNNFGNVVTNKDVPGLPAGYWQHTGVDYLLNGRSIDSQGQVIYAAGNGIVVFSTASNTNPLPKRGGLVIIRHLAPAGEQYQIPKYKRTEIIEKELATIFYNSYSTNEIFTYYLHLDPRHVVVSQGDQVKAGQPIANLYYIKDVPSRFVYVPHLHFEVWTRCAEIERNGYDLPGDKQFQSAVTKPLMDPLSLFSGNLLFFDERQQLAMANEAWKPFYEGFRIAVKNRDKVALKQMLSADFTCDRWKNGEYKTITGQTACLQEFSGRNNEGWNELDKILRNGEFQERESYDSMYLFYGNSCCGADFEFYNGRWYFISFDEAYIVN